MHWVIPFAGTLGLTPPAPHAGTDPGPPAGPHDRPAGPPGAADAPLLVLPHLERLLARLGDAGRPWPTPPGARAAQAGADTAGGPGAAATASTHPGAGTAPAADARNDTRTHARADVAGNAPDGAPGHGPAPAADARPAPPRLTQALSPADEPWAEHRLSLPHEHVLALAWGWCREDQPLPDGLVPMAAHAARLDGLQADAADARGWALLTPTHWHMGTEQVSLTPPADLALAEAESRTLFEALQPLWAEDGVELRWGSAQRWYALHPLLATLPTAALDRVIGRNVDIWLNTHPDARLFRRLQAATQMLLHTHPVNADREAEGLKPVNSVWISGTGRTPPLQAQPAPGRTLVVDERLRAPALAGDRAAWVEAWTRIDASTVRGALEAAEAGLAVALTLAGERQALRFELQPPRRGWRRWLAPRRVPTDPVLATL